MVKNTNKHMLRTQFDKELLKELDEAGEIRLATNGRVYGFEAFVKRLMRGKK